MPIFMDIHDTTGATPEDIATAHQKDLALQDKYKCKFVYFWHDIPNCTGFCVFEAPDKEAVIKLHNKTHNIILSNQIIEVELSVVESFLGKIANIAWSKKKTPFDGYIDGTAHRTIMFLEIANPISFKLKPNKSKFIDLCELQKKMIKDSFLKYEGNVISWKNNCILTSFLLEKNALKCSLNIQEKFANLSVEKDIKCNFSMGLSSGAPVTTSDNLFGDVIKLAKKLANIAGENQILLSSSLGKTYNEIKFGTEFKNSSIKVLSSRYENFLNQLFETFEKHWNEEELNINSMVAQFGISRAQLYRKIIYLTGYSPNNLIREIRLKNALKLIEIQKGSISEIAYESGFNNPSYFSKCFNKKFGILPSDYANSIV